MWSSTLKPQCFQNYVTSQLMIRGSVSTFKTYFYSNLFYFQSQAAGSRPVIYCAFRACHTTRPPYFGEGDRVDYHFISQEVFDEMLNMVRTSPLFVLHKKYSSSGRNIRN